MAVDKEKGLLAQETPKNGEPDDFTRTIVAIGEQALFQDQQMSNGLMQIANSGSTPANGIALALTVIIANARNAIVEQGHGVPMDIFFFPGGSAEILGKDIAEMIGADESVVPEAVSIAQQMMAQTDEQAMAGAQAMPQEGAMQPQGAQPEGQPAMLGGV